MSRIVEFRQNIIDTISSAIPDLREVDWYDGLFDEKDIDDWALKTPCAYVAVQNIPTALHHSTGELNTDLQCIVAVITEDTNEARNSDPQVWNLMEQIVTVVNLNQFGNANSAGATGIKFKRLRDPELRRQGIALGVVEWQSGLCIGRNRSLEREYIHDTQGNIVPFNPSEFLGYSTVTDRAGVSVDEEIDFSPPDDASPLPP